MPSASFTLTDSQGNATTVSAPFTVSAPSTLRFPGDPGVGKVYIGQGRGPESAADGGVAGIGIGGDPSDREATWGCPVGVFRSYFSWGQFDALVATAKRDHDAGRLPIVSIHTGSDGWKAMAAGTHDAEIKAVFAKLAALGKPVWFCVDHEPWDDQAAKGTPADFSAMNKRLMGMKPTNVAIVPILQTARFDPTQANTTDNTIASWYAPGSYDIVGIDDYNHKWFYPTPGNKWRDASVVMSFMPILRQQLGNPGAPIAICETAARTDPATPGLAAKWIHELVTLAKTNNVVAISWFDSGRNIFDGSSPMWLDWAGDGTDGRERLDAWGAEVKANAHL